MSRRNNSKENQILKKICKLLNQFRLRKANYLNATHKLRSNILYYVYGEINKLIIDLIGNKSHFNIEIAKLEYIKRTINYRMNEGNSLLTNWFERGPMLKIRPSGQCCDDDNPLRV